MGFLGGVRRFYGVAKTGSNCPPSTEICGYSCRWVSLRRPRSDSALSNGGLSMCYGRTAPTAGICVETAHGKAPRFLGSERTCSNTFLMNTVEAEGGVLY